MFIVNAHTFLIALIIYNITDSTETQSVCREVKLVPFNNIMKYYKIINVGA